MEVLGHTEVLLIRGVVARAAVAVDKDTTVMFCLLMIQ